MKFKLACILALLSAEAAAATTATVTTPPTFDLYQGSALVSPRVTRPTFTECVEAGRLLGKGDGCQSRNGKFKLVVVADPPVTPPVTPPVPVWAHASAEGRDFTLYAPAKVRFGADTRWITKDYPAGLVRCRFDVIGDPAPGVTKTCQASPGSALQATPSTPLPPAVGTASLTWLAVTSYTDGTALSGPVTYRIYRGASASSLQQVGEVSVRTFSIQGLASGTHYFAVSAVAGGVEGELSATGSKAIP